MEVTGSELPTPQEKFSAEVFLNADILRTSAFSSKENAINMKNRLQKTQYRIYNTITKADGIAHGAQDNIILYN